MRQPALLSPIAHRPMTLADLDRVLALEVQAYSHPWSRGNFIDSLAAGYQAVLRLGADAQLLGYFLAQPGFQETHLLNLTVAPRHQRQGHGQALVAQLQAWARARGDQALWLEVRASNPAALALYRRLGFMQMGLRKGYYPASGQQREDALVLRLNLVTSPGEPRPLDAGGPHALV